MSDDDPIRTIRLDGDEPPKTSGTERTEDTDTEASADDFRAPFTADEPERTPAMRKLEQQLAAFYVDIGIYGGMFTGKRGMLTGTVISANAGMLAGSWVDLAERDPAVKRALTNLVQSSGWAGVLGAHVAVILPVLAIWGVLPEQMAAMVWMAVDAQNPALGNTLREQAVALGMFDPAQNGNGNS